MLHKNVNIKKISTVFLSYGQANNKLTSVQERWLQYVNRASCWASKGFFTIMKLFKTRMPVSYYQLGEKVMTGGKNTIT